MFVTSVIIVFCFNMNYVKNLLTLLLIFTKKKKKREKNNVNSILLQLLKCKQCQNTYHGECFSPLYPTKLSRKKKIWVSILFIQKYLCRYIIFFKNRNYSFIIFIIVASNYVAKHIYIKKKKNL